MLVLDSLLKWVLVAYAGHQVRVYRLIMSGLIEDKMFRLQARVPVCSTCHSEP